VKVVSDASPLISFARIGHFDLLPKLFGRILIPAEVYQEVVVDGAALPGAFQTARADWVEVVRVHDIQAVAAMKAEAGLGTGEASAIALAREIGADLLLVDERKARLVAKSNSIAVQGCIGILETLHRRGHLDDLRGSFVRLLQQGIRVELKILHRSLVDCGLPPL
jgi:predicted nucleic acid-binding protein